MKLLFVTCFISLFFIQCSPRPTGSTSKDIADAVKSGDFIPSVCTGSECCSEHKSCIRICDQIFYKSEGKVRKKCQALPQDVVQRLEELMLVLKNPLQDDLGYLDLSEDFRLLLALDYQVWARTIQTYTVDDAREFLIWASSNRRLVEELLKLKVEARNELVYEMLASAGGRDRPGPIEEGLSRKISFDQSFFQLLVSYSNYDMLQITHDMIREDLCSVQYGGDSQTELCMLRIYCKEKINQDDSYVHSEDLRNEIARNVKDEELFDYVEKEILHAGLGVRFTEPIMNNQVCFIACNDSNRSCE